MDNKSLHNNSTIQSYHLKLPVIKPVLRKPQHLDICPFCFKTTGSSKLVSYCKESCGTNFHESCRGDQLNHNSKVLCMICKYKL